MTLYRPLEAEPGELRFKIYRAATPLRAGRCAADARAYGPQGRSTEEPFEVARRAARRSRCGCRISAWFRRCRRDRHRRASMPRFETAFAQVWAGAMESDGFNRLVLAAGLDWRAGDGVAALCEGVAPGGLAPTARPIWRMRSRTIPPIAARSRGAVRGALRSRRCRAAPRRRRARAGEGNRARARCGREPGRRPHPAELPALHREVAAHQLFPAPPGGAPKPYLSVKLASREIELMPLPRPLFEIFVYSPRDGGRAFARRQDRARRHPLVRPHARISAPRFSA